MDRSCRVFFVTFADSRMQKSLKRIEKQARSLNVFDTIYVWNEKKLSKDFVCQFKDRLQKGTRGYGYWCWKPQVVLQALEHMKMGDVLCYADVGCHMRSEGTKRLQEYIDLVIQFDSGIVGFQGMYLEKDWTKGDLFDYFNVREHTDITHTETIIAGSFFIKKTPQTVDLIKKWKKVYEDSFSLADDTPSISPNLQGFVENRHDQSIFSILCKKAGATTVPLLEIYPTKDDVTNPSNWVGHQDFPIWAMRDKQMKFLSKIDLKLRIRFLKFIVRLIPIRSVRKRIRQSYRK